MRIYLNTWCILLASAALVIFGGCRHLRPKSEIDHLISLMQDKDSSRTDSESTVAAVSPLGESQDDLSKLPTPFRLADVEPLIGSGLPSEPEQKIVSNPVTVEPGLPSAPKPKPALIATIPTKSAVTTSSNILIPSNPLRPLNRRQPERSLESLVKDWAHAPKLPLHRRRDRIPAALSHYESSTSLVLNCVDPNCDKCTESANNTDVASASTGKPQQDAVPCGCGENMGADCPSHSSIRLAGHSERVPDSNAKVDVLSEWANSEQSTIDDDHLVSSPTRQLARPKRLSSNLRSQIDWNDRLEQTIVAITNEMETASEAPACNAAKLRMLRMLSGNIASASDPVQQFTESEQQGWLAQMAAVDNMIALAEKDWSESNETQRRQLVRRCLQQLRQAMLFLASSAPLQIQQTELCTSVQGFGQYTLAPAAHLKSQNTVLVYCELENLTHRQIKNRNDELFETRVSGQVSILDPTGREIHRFEFPDIVDQSRRHRRDYFVYLPFRIPKLDHGKYRVVTSMTDLNDDARVAQSEMDLEVH